MERMRSVIVATGILVVGLAPFGVAATGDLLREGVRNGTATRETEIIANEAASTAAKGGYATRQSNVSGSGGGAIYGCRSGPGGTDSGREPCLRASNVREGRAFEFHSRSGDEVGRISIGIEPEGKPPFTTNATGVATGLNADRVDGADAGALRTRWVLVNELGQIEEQSGGFTVLDAYQTNQSVYIDTGSPVEGKGLTATIAFRNVNGTERNGEISVARCQMPGVVECAPASAKTPNAVVVNPRESDGTATGPNTRKRFYLVVTE
jgi:hypothetical protein